MVAPSWAAYGVSKAFFTEKAKEENKIKLPAFLEQTKSTPVRPDVDTKIIN
jgi:hypothetical protein